MQRPCRGPAQEAHLRSAARVAQAGEAVDLAVEGQDVELALRVLAEGGDVQLLLTLAVDQLAVDDGLAVLVAEAPDPAGVEVAVDVDAGQLGQGLAAVDVAAGDALADVRDARAVGAVGILDDRRGDRRSTGSAFCRRLGWNGWNPSLMLQP